MHHISISPKYIEIIMILVHQQNKQLIKIISEEENIDINKLEALITPQHKLFQMLVAISSSESSVSSSDSCSSSSSEVE
jgi:hypothetical protein